MSFHFLGWTAKKNISIGREAGYYFINLSSNNFDFPSGYQGDSLAIVDISGFYKIANTINYEAENQSGWIILYQTEKEAPPRYLLYKGGLARNPMRGFLNYTIRDDEREIYHAYAPCLNGSKSQDCIGNITADVFCSQVVRESFFGCPAWKCPPTKVEANISVGEDIELDLWIKLIEAPNETTPILVKETNGTVQLGIYMDPDGYPFAVANVGPWEFIEIHDTQFPLNEYHLLLARLVRSASDKIKLHIAFQNEYCGSEYMTLTFSGYGGQGKLVLSLNSGSAEISGFRVWQGKLTPDSVFDSYKGFLYRAGKLYHIDKAGVSRGEALIY